MAREKPIDARQKMISLGAAIVIVLFANWLYGYAYKKWYSNPQKVISRLHEECTETIQRRVSNAKAATPEQKAEYQNKGYQECQRLKESCMANFNQQFCLIAQKMYQDAK